jgi:hypothetical protein
MQMASSLGRNADFRQRERHAAREMQKQAVIKQALAAAHTHDAIDRFEEVLLQEEEKRWNDNDDLPLDAEAGSYARSSNNKSWRQHLLDRRDSDYDLSATLKSGTLSRSGPLPDDRPRSLLAQQKQLIGESMQAARHTHSGFRFRGPQYQIESCLVAPRAHPLQLAASSKRGAQPRIPARPARPLSEGNGRSNQEGYSGRSYGERVPMGLRENDRRQDDAQDSLDSQTDMSNITLLATHILSSLQTCLRNSRGGLNGVFQVDMGMLEPEEFLSGLIRLGIVADGELSVEQLVEVLPHIDATFDGYVNLASVAKAVNAARKTQGQQQGDRQNKAKANASYCESLPVEVVKVEKEPRSLFDFERQYEKFRKQQRVLLEHHNEVPHQIEEG